MKRIFTLLTLALATGNALAAPVPEGTAKTVAQNFLAQKYMPGIRIGLAKTYSDASGQTTFYIYNIEDTKGFVIVAGDDVIKPVLAYSTESKFQAEHLAPQVAYWLNGYNSVISSVISRNLTPTDAISAKWTKLLGNSTHDDLAARPTSVDPLMATSWDQWPYYNDLSPIPGASLGSTPSGCVATAMAQIMKYWNYPETGTGSHSYVHDEYGTQSADFSATTYDWDNMPAYLDGGSTATQVAAVSTLMYHCGVAVEMEFGTGEDGGSGAYTVNYGMSDLPCAQNALKDFFKYKETIEGLHRDDYSDEDWIALLEAELEAGRPILYSGQGDLGGHAWVLDGYDDDDFFHVNWGWSGVSNGYFSIDDMDPESLGAGGGGGGFYFDHAAIVKIEPDETEEPEPEPEPEPTGELIVYVAPVAAPATIAWNQDFDVTATLWNDSENDFVGDYTAAVYRVADSSFVSYIQTFTSRTVEAAEQPAVIFTTAGIAAMTPGNYFIKLLYREAGTATWEIIPAPDSIGNRAVITVAGATSFDEMSEDDLISLYPNPAKNTITLNLNGVAVNEVQVVNIQGQKVFATNKTENVMSIPVNQLADGMYLVQLRTGKGTIAKKIIIQH